MIVIGGENLIDFVQQGMGETGPLYEAIPGGSPFNVAMAIGRQGHQVGYLTPISDDRLGDLLAARLQADAVELLAPRVQEPSSLAVVSLTDGQASYGFYREGTSERQVGAQSVLPDATQAFHVGSLALIDGADAERWEALHNEAASAGYFTSLDPNLRPLMVKAREPYVARLRRIYQTVDLLKLSDEDLHWLYPNTSLDDAMAQLRRETDAGLLVVTRGGDGATALRADTRIDLPGRVANPYVDTVGAGDTFMATLIAQCVSRKWTSKAALATRSDAEIGDLLVWAGTAASLNVEKSGCQPPYAKELNAALL